jgi:DNA-binding NtrC family response regulator
VQVLIVEENCRLSDLWSGHLTRAGHAVHTCADAGSAILALSERAFDIIVLDLVLSEGSALAVADYAEVRHPGVRVIFVTNTRFFSDGSIFALSGNACAFLPTHMPPEDLAAMVEHHGAAP